MGLFKKKEKKEEAVPKLPELPRLPELPDIAEFQKYTEEKLPQLPSFPNGDLGNRFSQNTIKEAITGKKEEEVQAEEMEEEIPMMRKPLIQEESKNYFERTQSSSEPIFIRIDRFEEGSKSFEEVRKKVADIEKMLTGIKQIKEEEEKELESWTNEVIKIKEKMEKVDDNIFSKIK